jgi:hypothetical protein
MIIDDKTYRLPTSNYIQAEDTKKRIVLANSNNNNMRHVIGWLSKYNGRYTKTAAFTVTSSGLIYMHFNPKYTSEFFKDKNFNSGNIVIVVENDGYLTKNKSNENELITWIGDIYSQSNNIVEKTWRGYDYWPQYTQEQFEAVNELVITLCDRFDIPKTTIGHNTKINGAYDYTGVLCRSNIERYYTDLNPTWDFELFKKNLEDERTD